MALRVTQASSLASKIEMEAIDVCRMKGMHSVRCAVSDSVPVHQFVGALEKYETLESCTAVRGNERLNFSPRIWAVPILPA